MNGPAIASGQEESIPARVLAEEVDLVYRMFPASIIGQILYVTAVGGIHWKQAARVPLLAWMGTLGALLVARLLLFQAYRKAHPGPREAPLWARRARVIVFLSGAAWGAGSFLLPPGIKDFPSLFFVVLMYSTISANLLTMAPVPGLLRAFLIPFLLPLLLWTVLPMTGTATIFTGLFTFGGFWADVLARRYRATTENALRLHFENLALVEQLGVANAELGRSQEKISQLMADSPDLLENIEGWVNRMTENLAEFTHSCPITAIAFEGSRLQVYGPPVDSLPSLSALAQLKGITHLPEGTMVLPARGPSGDLVGVVAVQGDLLLENAPLRKLLEGFAHQFGAGLEMLHIRTRLHAVEATQAKTLEEFHAKGISTLQICRKCGRCYDHTQMVCAEDGGKLEVPRALPFRFLGRYRFLCSLGAGGMGAVYAAEDEQLNRLVAIKLIRPELLSETALRLRFEREAQSIAKVHHPGVVTLYDSGSTGDGQLYLIMEHLRGLDVASALRRFGRAHPSQAARFVRQGAHALGAAHEVKVIHRDLKPQNLFLVPHSAEGFQLKILDFGLAKNPDSDHHLTRTGLIMGSPQYMAPEQMRGKETDERTDLFAFAAVAYEVVTGKPVLAANRVSDVLHGKLQHGHKPPSTLVESLPPEVDELFSQALAQRPEDRPHDLGKWAEVTASLLERVPGEGGWPEEIPVTQLLPPPKVQVPTAGLKIRPMDVSNEEEATRVKGDL